MAGSHENAFWHKIAILLYSAVCVIKRRADSQQHKRGDTRSSIQKHKWCFLNVFKSTARWWLLFVILAFVYKYRTQLSVIITQPSEL